MTTAILYGYIGAALLGLWQRGENRRWKREVDVLADDDVEFFRALNREEAKCHYTAIEPAG